MKHKGNKIESYYENKGKDGTKKNIEIFGYDLPKEEKKVE